MNGTDLTRRGFFRLAAGAAAVVAMPAPVLLAAAETIWCDGVHDDAPGLSALIRGDVVQFMQPELAEWIGWRGNTLTLEGDFTLMSIVDVERSGVSVLRGGLYNVHHGGVVFRVCAPGMNYLELIDMTLVREGHPQVVGFATQKAEARG